MVISPATAGVLVGFAVCCRVLVPIRRLASRGAVALPRPGRSLGCVRRVDRASSRLRGRLMLAVCSVAVFRNRRASPTPIGIGALLSLAVRPGLWVVGLTHALAAIAVRDSGTTCVRSGGRIVARAIVRRAVWTIR